MFPTIKTISLSQNSLSERVVEGAKAVLGDIHRGHMAGGGGARIIALPGCLQSLGLFHALEHVVYASLWPSSSFSFYLSNLSPFSLRHNVSSRYSFSLFLVHHHFKHTLLVVDTWGVSQGSEMWEHQEVLLIPGSVTGIVRGI